MKKKISHCFFDVISSFLVILRYVNKIYLYKNFILVKILKVIFELALICSIIFKFIFELILKLYII